MRSILLWALRLILIPFSLAYGFAMEIRNILFDLGLLSVYRSKLPVVAVGNISVGGTGKTPFTIWLAQRLGGRFGRVAVVSRGYGRQSKGMKIVAENGNIVCDVQNAGDEPMLIARKIPQALVLVAENRKKAIRHIELTEAADVIILDDAFQHRWVARDADIVLWRSGGFWDCWPLPTGRLREAIWNLKRADYVIYRSGHGTRFIPEERQFKAEFGLEIVVDEYFKEQGEIGQWQGKKIVAFAGIAHPEGFFEMLRLKGIETAAVFAFADHYRYDEDVLRKILQSARQHHAEWILCTEKDLVKIREFLPVLETEIKLAGVRFGAVSLKVRLEREKEFVNDLIKRLTKA